MEFLEQADSLLRTFWYVALPTSLIFLIQTIMTFVGLDSADGASTDLNMHTDADSGHFQVFSLRNLINFLLGFSWSGISFYEVISNKYILVFICIQVGLAFVGLFFVILKQMQKLSEDNTFKLEDTLQKTADVYLNIPAQRSGTGKVMVSVKGAVHELGAITDGDRIESGAVVRIVRLEAGLLVVERL